MNRHLKIFLFSAGAYLSLLTGLFLTQPKSGYSPSIEQVLLYILVLIPIWILFIGTYSLYKKYPKSKTLQLISKKKTVYILLILLLIIGFIFNLDYHRQIGCFVQNESTFSELKFILVGSSILLLTIGYLKSNKKIGIAILIAEFIFWTLKSLYFNSSMDLIIPGYFTMTCWLLRYTLIAICINKNANKKTNC